MYNFQGENCATDLITSEYGATRPAKDTDAGRFEPCPDTAAVDDDLLHKTPQNLVLGENPRRISRRRHASTRSVALPCRRRVTTTASPYSPALFTVQKTHPLSSMPFSAIEVQAIAFGSSAALPEQPCKSSSDVERPSGAVHDLTPTTTAKKNNNGPQ